MTPVDGTTGPAPVRAALAEFGPSAASPFFLTMANNPVVLPLWGRLVRGLLDATLPARDRELLILRTAHQCGAAYPWNAHLGLGRRAGLSEAEIERIRADDLSSWDGRDRDLLDAADELHRRARISDSTWQRLTEHYSPAQLVEIPVLVGFYHLNSYAANSLDVGVAMTEPAERTG